MKDKIVRKLRDHLSRAVDTECTVVYLLSETRKLIERDSPEPVPFALKMYCHWALHINLSKPNTTKNFLERVDKFILKKVHPYKDDGTFPFLDEHYLFKDFVYLDTFRQELRNFLSSYELSTAVCDDNERWFALLSAYANVIEEGELTITGKHDAALKAVEKVVFRKGEAAPAGNHVPFIIQWDIHLKDGRICQIEAEANPAEGMISHGLQIIQNVTVPRSS